MRKVPATSLWALTLGWAGVAANVLVQGAGRALPQELVGRSFSALSGAMACPGYVSVAAPVFLGWSGFIFLKCALREGPAGAKLGLWVSMLLLAMWIDVAIEHAAGRMSP